MAMSWYLAGIVERYFWMGSGLVFEPHTAWYSAGSQVTEDDAGGGAEEEGGPLIPAPEEGDGRAPTW